MLILILTNAQYLQKVVFSFETDFIDARNLVLLKVFVIKMICNVTTKKYLQ